MQKHHFQTSIKRFQMAEMSWEKPAVSAAPKSVASGERIKFVVGGLLLLGAVVYLMISGTIGGAQYFMTVDDIVASSAYAGQTVRISGAVDGETIVYDAQNLIIDFEIAHIPLETNDLALTLHNAVNDASATRL